LLRCMALCLVCAWLGAGCSDGDGTEAKRETVRYVTAEDVETEKWNSYVELANTVDPVVRSYLADEELLRKEAVASAEADRILASARQVGRSARTLLESAREGRRFGLNSLAVGTPGHYSRELGLLTVRYNRLGGAPEPGEE